MVWQDYMCDELPPAGFRHMDDAERDRSVARAEVVVNFMENVEEEAVQQFTRLRSHPSLALWCGNNELEVAWNNWGWQDRYGCLLYTSDAADERSRVDLGGRRIIKKTRNTAHKDGVRTRTR